MAGSYHHAVNKKTGKLRDNASFVGMVENLGDAYETVEEMYGMIQVLANTVAGDGRFEGLMTPAQIIEDARLNYEEGLELGGVMEEGEEDVEDED